MDINGAKALKKRLGESGEVEPQPAPASVDVPADAPPVYQWLGVSQPEPEAPPVEDDGERPAEAASLFRRLGLSFR